MHSFLGVLPSQLPTDPSRSRLTISAWRSIAKVTLLKRSTNPDEGAKDGTTRRSNEPSGIASISQAMAADPQRRVQRSMRADVGGVLTGLEERAVVIMPSSTATAVPAGFHAHVSQISRSPGRQSGGDPGTISQQVGKLPTVLLPDQRRCPHGSVLEGTFEQSIRQLRVFESNSRSSRLAAGGCVRKFPQHVEKFPALRVLVVEDERLIR